MDENNLLLTDPDEKPLPRYPAVGINSTNSSSKVFDTTTPRSSPLSASTFTKSPGTMFRGAMGDRTKFLCARLKCTYNSERGREVEVEVQYVMH